MGPTGVGKTELALHLAGAFPAEVVNADSRQVYRYMDIGTAKPSREQRDQVPHHLLDIVDPDQDFSLALYQEMAYQAIQDVRRRGKLPLLVGGSGLYVWAVVEGWQIPRVAPDRELRRSLVARAQREGATALYEELRKLDPAAASRIDPRNLRRLIRALEVCLKTGRGFSQLGRKAAPTYPILILGLTTRRDELYRRVDSRIDGMVEQGWVEEVAGLMARGFSPHLPAMSGVGYKQIGMYVQGRCIGLATAIQQAKYATHRFARRQYAWFRLSDSRIHWLEIGEGVGEAAKTLVAQFVNT